MSETIMITEKSDLIVAKSGKTYFIVTTDKGETLLSFNTGIYNELQVGSPSVLEVNPSKKPDGDRLIMGFAKDTASPKPIEGQPAHGPAPQEIGMWFKELGEMLRAGDIKDQATHKLLRSAYYAQMFASLGIKIKEVKDETSKAVEIPYGEEVKRRSAEPDKREILLHQLLALQEKRNWKDFTIVTKVGSIVKRQFDRETVIADLPALLNEEEIDTVNNEIGALVA